MHFRGALGLASWIHPIASEALRRAGDVRTVHHELALARAVLEHTEPVCEWSGLTISLAAAVSEGGRHRILIRPDLPPLVRRWCVLHEVAEVLLQRIGYDEPDTEAAAEALAAALAVPRAHYLDAISVLGHRFPELSRVYSCTQTCVALRLAETTGRPVAVVADGYVRAHDASALALVGSDQAVPHPLTDSARYALVA